MNKFYLTTAIPYVNARPHIGHALEFVQADAIRRYQQLLGNETCLLSGADENSLKNVQASEKAGKDVQSYVDEYAVYFEELARALEVQFDVFQKGSNQKTHYPASQKLWELCEKNGDIYKKSYEGLYCVGCETFYEKEELNEKGECFEHPGKSLDIVSEENYFFKLSSYQQKLLKLIESDELKIVPETKKNEIVSFLNTPLQDISVSRSNERAKNWGVPVPGDDSQRMYVWFDALNIYQSGVGFGWDDETYGHWWPADVHVIGKGIIRFHAVYWPAFLMSAGLQLPKKLFVHGYITIDGQKMSKALGNVIDPIELLKKYGADPFRYYFLREISSHNDGDFSEQRFVDIYNSHLAGGVGNLLARVSAMLDKYFDGVVPEDEVADPFIVSEIWNDYQKAMDEFRFDDAVRSVWRLVDSANKYVDDQKPWALAKSDQKQLGIVLTQLLETLRQIAVGLMPVMPNIADSILLALGSSSESVIKDTFEGAVQWGGIKKGQKVEKGAILFPRIETKA